MQVQKLGFPNIWADRDRRVEKEGAEGGRREKGEEERERGLWRFSVFGWCVCIRGWITPHTVRCYDGTPTFFKGFTGDFITKNLTTPLVWKWPPTRAFVTSKSTFRITVKMMYSHTTNLYFSTYAPCFLL